MPDRTDQGYIASEKIATVVDLYQTWQDVQAGKSKAVILDVRTRAEFEAGHILVSNNVDSAMPVRCLTSSMIRT